MENKSTQRTRLILSKRHRGVIAVALLIFLLGIISLLPVMVGENSSAAHAAVGGAYCIHNPLTCVVDQSKLQLGDGTWQIPS